MGFCFVIVFDWDGSEGGGFVGFYVDFVEMDCFVKGVFDGWFEEVKFIYWDVVCGEDYVGGLKGLVEGGFEVGLFVWDDFEVERGEVCLGYDWDEGWMVVVVDFVEG